MSNVDDDHVLRETINGRSARSLSKELRCSVAEVHAALGRTLPKIDNDLRARHIAIDLQRLDELISVFLKRAIEQKDVPPGMLVVKALERKAALLGLDQPTKFDVVQVTTRHEPRSFDRIREAVYKVAGRPPPPLNRDSDDDDNNKSPEDLH
jgi:hypothetical protein